MREILFRGKEIGIDRWVHGSLDIHKSGVVVIMSDEIVTSIYARVDPDTVGQFTGLTDKNGKKIFEGDIVQAKEPDTSYRFGCVWALQVVVFREGSYGLLEFNKFFTSFRSFALSVTFEVVGNIHDNPELMEGK